MQTILKGLTKADQQLFLLLNSYHNAFWDVVMSAASSRTFWVPLYIVTAAGLVYLYKQKCFWLLPVIGLAVLLTDRISSGLFKPYFARLRPCHEPALQNLVHTVNSCGGQFGFISSHAANTFALAIIMHLLLTPKYNSIRLFFWLWAVTLSYSRIYLGVHYPADVLLGSILGCLIGWLLVVVFRLIEKHWYKTI